MPRALALSLGLSLALAASFLPAGSDAAPASATVRARIERVLGDPSIPEWKRELTREWILDHPTEEPDLGSPADGGPQLEQPVADQLVAVDGDWSSHAPPFKYRHSMLFDPVRDRLVSFGGFGVSGQNGGVFSDVWVMPMSGNPAWTSLPVIGTRPTPRYASSLVYDSIRDRYIVFGGQSNGGSSFNDVWVLPMTGTLMWQKLAPLGTPPAARNSHTTIFDPVRNRLIVFGGLDGSASNRDDVWQLSLQDTVRWTQILPAGAIPARRSHTAIYDPIRDRMLVFGGFGDYQSALNDLWVLNLSGTPAWNSLPATGIPGRRNHTAVYDPVRDRMLVFGGCNGMSCFGDTWALTLAGTPAWTAFAATGPIGRYGHGAAYDPVRDRMMMFAGRDTMGNLELTAMLRGDTWALSLAGTPAWTPVPGLLRYGHTLVYDRFRDRVLVHGGTVGTSDRADVWALPLPAGSVWSSVTTTGTAPSARFHHAAILDDRRDRMVVFGGQNTAGTCTNDLWSLALSGTASWSPLVATGTPPDAREGHGAVLDAARDRMLVFGGRKIQSGGPWFNDVWALSLTNPAWTKLLPTGTPPAARRGAVVVYDRKRDRLLVHGGTNAAGTLLSDTWELSLGATPAWTQLVTSGGPVTLSGHVGVYDNARDRLVVFGGWGGTPATWRGDTWALELGAGLAWFKLPNPETGPPRPRVDAAGFYDARRDSLVIFGGYGSYPTRLGPLDDTWALVWATPVDVPLQRLPGLALGIPMPNPTRGGCRLDWELPARAKLRVEIYDPQGRRVRALVDGERPAGRGSAWWDGRDERGSLAPTGLYFWRLETGGRAATRRVVLAR